jgi:Yip1-like protein
MAAAPVLPASPTPTPGSSSGLSEGARITNTFIAPSKTFTDLRRSAAWWGPFLLMVIASVGFVYVAGQKVGFRKAMENQMQSQPKAQARLENLPPDQREQQMEQGAKVTKIIAYAFPVIQLLILLFIAAVMFATFKFAAGADVTFKISLAIVMYASLPGLLKVILAVVSLLAGGNVDSFTFQNPVATNPGYFMNPADSPFLYSLASSLDIFLIWTLILTAIGFTCVSKVKRGTALAIVFGWWAVLTLAGAALGAAFS